MKTRIATFVLLLGMAGFSAQAQSNKTIQQEENNEPRMEERADTSGIERQTTNERRRATENARDNDRITRTEIGSRELPEEARMDIVDNYHNPQILRVYHITYTGTDAKGYLVEVQKGPKVWTIEYDEEGNPTNKINPQH